MSYILARVRTGRVNGLRGLYGRSSCGETCTERDIEATVRGLRRSYIYERVDPEINMVFYERRPVPGIEISELVVRWEGFLEVYRPGRYRLYIVADDGARVYLDRELVIDAWSGRTLEKTYSREISLERGPHLIEIEYYNTGDFGKIELGWRREQGFEEVIPSKNLFTFIGGSVIMTNIPRGYKIKLVYNGYVREAVMRSGIALIPVIDIVRPSSEGQFIIIDERDRIIYKSPLIEDLYPGDVYSLEEIPEKISEKAQE